MVSSNFLLSNLIKSLLPPGGSIQGSHNCVFKSGPLRANPGTLSCLITTIWEAQLGLNISQCLLSSDAIYHGKKLHPNKILELTAFIFANNHNPSPPPTTRLASPGKMWQPVVIRLLWATLQLKTVCFSHRLSQVRWVCFASKPHLLPGLDLQGRVSEEKSEVSPSYFAQTSIPAQRRDHNIQGGITQLTREAAGLLS